MFFVDPASNPNKRNFRDGQECQTYQNLIMDPKTTKLGDVFNLKVVSIHNRAFELLILNIFIILAYLIILLGAEIIKCIPGIELIMSIVMYAAGIAIYIAMPLMTLGFILILYFFFSSDSGEYKRFLECRNVDYLGFARFRDAEALRSDFYFYLFCNLIPLLLGYSADKPKKPVENEDNIKNE